MQKVREPVPLSVVEELMARATTGWDEDEQSSSDDLTGRNAILRLRGLANREVLDASLAACTAAAPLRRRVGAAVLGQLGQMKAGFEPVFVEERYEGLASLLDAESRGAGDPDVLADVCYALGHLHDPRAIPALLGLRGHPDAKVRYGVAFGLGGHETVEAMSGLITLSDDNDADVRDWSTFALAKMIDTDTAQIRTALKARLDDPCIAARDEAVLGLAVRGERSVIPVLIRELHTGVALPLLEAAVALARPELCEALTAAKEGGLVIDASYGPYDLTSVWEEAVEACGCRDQRVK